MNFGFVLMVCLSLGLVESASVRYGSGSYGASSYGAHAAAPAHVAQSSNSAPVAAPVPVQHYAAPEPVAAPAPVVQAYSAPVAAPVPVQQYAEVQTPALEVIETTLPLEIITTTPEPVAELFVPETTTAYVPPVQYAAAVPVVQSYYAPESTTTTTEAPAALAFVTEVQYVNQRPALDFTEAPVLTFPSTTVGQVAYGQVESKEPVFVTEFVETDRPALDLTTEELLTTVPAPVAEQVVEVRIFIYLWTRIMKTIFKNLANILRLLQHHTLLQNRLWRSKSHQSLKPMLQFRRHQHQLWL
jgi:hypothetical protein